MAQLGARFHGMEEVEGSTPSRSTTFSPFVFISLAAPFRAVYNWRTIRALLFIPFVLLFGGRSRDGCGQSACHPGRQDKHKLG